MKIESSSAGVFRIELNGAEHQIVAKLGVIYGMSDSEVMKYMLAFARHMAVTRILIPVEQSL